MRLRQSHHSAGRVVLLALSIAMADIACTGTPPVDVTAPRRGQVIAESLRGSASGRPTVLLVLNSSCPYCLDAMPKYRRLLQSVSSSAPRVVLVGTEPVATLRGFAEEYGVHAADVRSVPSRELLQIAAPAMLLLDGAGRLMDYAIGEPSQAVLGVVAKQLLALQAAR